MNPLFLILWSGFAAMMAGVGALLGTRRFPLAGRSLGWANASAAGLMLGVGYAVLSAGQALVPAAAFLGAIAGLLLMGLVDAAPRAPLITRLPGASEWVLASGLHSAIEGIAIGSAATLGAPFGNFLIATFAVHNVSEGAVLGTTLVESGWRRPHAALVTTGARALQPLAAVLILEVTGAAPAAEPWLLGAAFGALLYLILAEMLPDAYRQAGRTSIAAVVSLAAGVVALLSRGAR
jgi:ZIP family zinc transporter